MPSRLELQTLLEELLGSRNVYFQPPESVKMKYPAIVYGLDNIENSFADDGVYLSKKKYLVTVIDEDPDSPIVDKVASLPTCRFNRHFQSDNLNHYVFILYF
jgi:hypothetical protein